MALQGLRRLIPVLVGLLLLLGTLAAGLITTTPWLPSQTRGTADLVRASRLITLLFAAMLVLGTGVIVLGILLLASDIRKGKKIKGMGRLRRPSPFVYLIMVALFIFIVSRSESMGLRRWASTTFSPEQHKEGLMPPLELEDQSADMRGRLVNGPGGQSSRLMPILAGLISVSFVALIWAILRRPIVQDPARDEVDGDLRLKEIMVDAVQTGITSIAADEDPRRGILACYSKFQSLLGDCGFPVPAHYTAEECLSAALSRFSVPSRPVSSLTQLFHEARFSPAPMDESHRQQALRALHAVESALKGDGGEALGV